MPFDEILNEKTDTNVTASAVPVFNADNTSEMMNIQSLAMAYVPYQSWEEIYAEEEALKRGTLFAQLYKPYIGGNRPK